MAFSTQNSGQWLCRHAYLKNNSPGNCMYIIDRFESFSLPSPDVTSFTIEPTIAPLNTERHVKMVNKFSLINFRLSGMAWPFLLFYTILWWKWEMRAWNKDNFTKLKFNCWVRSVCASLMCSTLCKLQKERKRREYKIIKSTRESYCFDTNFTW